MQAGDHDGKLVLDKGWPKLLKIWKILAENTENKVDGLESMVYGIYDLLLWTTIGTGL